MMKTLILLSTKGDFVTAEFMTESLIQAVEVGDAAESRMEILILACIRRRC